MYTNGFIHKEDFFLSLKSNSILRGTEKTVASILSTDSILSHFNEIISVLPLEIPKQPQTTITLC